MDSNTASESDMLTSMQQVTLFFETLSICSLQQHAIIVPKNLHLFPTMEEKQAGTIDVWWILHEGGLLLLLGYLLQHDADALPCFAANPCSKSAFFM